MSLPSSLANTKLNSFPAEQAFAELQQGPIKLSPLQRPRMIKQIPNVNTFFKKLHDKHLQEILGTATSEKAHADVVATN